LGGVKMKELLEEYSNKYINDSTQTKIGYCKRCLNEKWKKANQKQTLYKYILPKEIIYICYDHVGCMEIARELVSNRKPKNDIEKHKLKKELDVLIEEGVKLKSSL
jgi:ATP-dependent protease HslVU (ClpYQ) ATPase subunit